MPPLMIHILCYSLFVNNEIMAASAIAKESTRPKLDCKDLHGYVKTLPPSVLDKLYDHPATCLAIFR